MLEASAEFVESDHEYTVQLNLRARLVGRVEGNMPAGNTDRAGHGEGFKNYADVSLLTRVGYPGGNNTAAANRWLRIRTVVKDGVFGKQLSHIACLI